MANKNAVLTCLKSQHWTWGFVKTGHTFPSNSFSFCSQLCGFPPGIHRMNSTIHQPETRLGNEVAFAMTQHHVIFFSYSYRFLGGEIVTWASGNLHLWAANDMLLHTSASEWVRTGARSKTWGKTTPGWVSSAIPEIKVVPQFISSVIITPISLGLKMHVIYSYIYIYS